MFGDEYCKINTIWKRDTSNKKFLIMPDSWSQPEFELLANAPWRFTEKIDGTNIRMHFEDGTVTIGGRTNNAQVPTHLLAALHKYTDTERWLKTFPDANDVTLYGEGYGAKIQKGGGNYIPDGQDFILFDVKIGGIWLTWESVLDIGDKMDIPVVPVKAELSLYQAWFDLTAGDFKSDWPNVKMEGLVGRPKVELRDRLGKRIIAKMKTKDWDDYVADQENQLK